MSEEQNPLYHFDCPECGYDDVEAGGCVQWGDCYCPFCAEDNGRDVPLILTRIKERSL